MKAFTVIIVCVVAAGFSPAQTIAPARAPHGLVTIKLTWSREAIPQGAAAPRDEISGPVGRDDPRTDPVDTLRTHPSLSDSPPPSPGKPRYFYIYSLTVRNEGGKKIRGVFWEYVASDRDSGAELNRRRFISLQGVGPGEVTTLRAKTLAAPTNIITPGGLGKNERSPFTGSAEIRCILYTDATTWEAEGGSQARAELQRADALTHGRKGRRP